MEEKKFSPLPDEALEDVVGGWSRQQKSKATCWRCQRTLPESQVPGGFCQKCRDELAKEGVYPPI